MTLSEYRQKLIELEPFVYGKRIKFDFGEDGLIMIDGVNERVSAEDGVSHLTIHVSWHDFLDIAEGRLSGYEAFATQRIALEGDMRLARSLEQLDLNLGSE